MSPTETLAKYSAAVAFVAVTTSDGDQSIGTAFHVGQGVFVTARHVLENNQIDRVATVRGFRVPLDGERAKAARCFVQTAEGVAQPVHDVRPAELQITAGPFFHGEAGVDVAVFRVEHVDPELPWIPLGGHLDDWIGDNDFVLWESIVMGFPPIPMTKEPLLVAARAEINAVIDLRHARHVHFVLSATARGGFSGGPALIDGYLLGLVTSSLGWNHAPEELGFFTVVSVEPIFDCLCEHKLLPRAQVEPIGTSVWDEGLLPSS